MQKLLGSSLNLIKRDTLAGKFHKNLHFIKMTSWIWTKFLRHLLLIPVPSLVTSKILPNVETRARSEICPYHNDTFGTQFEKSTTKEEAHLCSSQTYLKRIFLLLEWIWPQWFRLNEIWNILQHPPAGSLTPKWPSASFQMPKLFSTWIIAWSFAFASE